MGVRKTALYSKHPVSVGIRGVTHVLYVHIHKRHIYLQMWLVMLWLEKIRTFPLFFNLICAFLGHVAFVLTLDKNPPLMEDTCWKVEFWIMFSKLSRAQRASIDFKNDWARPRTAVPPKHNKQQSCVQVPRGHCAGIVSKNQKVINQPNSNRNKYMVSKDTFYPVTCSNSVSYEEN